MPATIRSGEIEECQAPYGETVGDVKSRSFFGEIARRLGYHSSGGGGNRKATDDEESEILAGRDRAAREMLETRWV